MKRIFSISLFLVLALSLFACGGGGGACAECIDSDNDGICDVCEHEIDDSNGDEENGGEEPVADIALIEDGVPNFRIVLGSGISTDVRKYVDQNIVGKLKSRYDIELTSAQEGSSSDTPQETEVLIGDVTTRGEKYIFDRYELGKEGYMIKIVGKKERRINVSYVVSVDKSYINLSKHFAVYSYIGNF